MILGRYDLWYTLSYYHFGWTLFVHWDGQLQDAILWDKGGLSGRGKLNEKSIIAVDTETSSLKAERRMPSPALMMRKTWKNI